MLPVPLFFLVYGRFVENQIVETLQKNTFSGEGRFVEKKYKIFSFFSTIW
jgi:hypothetical protein